MKLRPYSARRDFEEIRNWITDERTHAMWSANLISFPIEQDEFERFLHEREDRTGESSYVVTAEDGQLIGFFCYTIDLAANEGIFKCIMNNPDYRGKGYGREMLELALKYAFEITNVNAARLYVYTNNTRARKCYESVGFVETGFTYNALSYRDESWDVCNMIIRKEAYMQK